MCIILFAWKFEYFWWAWFLILLPHPCLLDPYKAGVYSAALEFWFSCFRRNFQISALHCLSRFSNFALGEVSVIPALNVHKNCLWRDASSAWNALFACGAFENHSKLWMVNLAKITREFKLLQMNNWSYLTPSYICLLDVIAVNLGQWDSLAA